MSAWFYVTYLHHRRVAIATMNSCFPDAEGVPVVGNDNNEHRLEAMCLHIEMSFALDSSNYQALVTMRKCTSKIDW